MGATVTYPPQQPGQQHGGWWQPGGQHPPSWPHQPGGQHPHSEPQQRPDYGPYQGFGQPGPYGQPHGQPGPGGFGPPPKKKSPLPWILGGLGVLVALAIVITLVVSLAGGPGDPRPTAQAGVDKIKAKDFAGLAAMTCERQKGRSNDLDPMAELREHMSEQQAQQLLDRVRFDVRLDDVEDHGDDTATARMSGRMSMSILGSSTTKELGSNSQEMVVENGEWTFC